MTLIEVLVSLLLFCLALGLLAGFVARATSVMRFSSGKDRGIESARLVLNRMQDELTGAVQVQTPGTVTAHQLVFVRLDPRLAGRLPLPLLSPTSWDPVDPAFLLKVTYQVVDGRLQRSVLHNDGSSQQEFLLDEVEDLVSEPVTASSYRLTLRVRDSMRVNDWILLAGVRIR